MLVGALASSAEPPHDQVAGRALASGKPWTEHTLPLVPDPLVRAISANRRIAAASDAMPGDYISEEKLKGRIEHRSTCLPSISLRR